MTFIKICSCTQYNNAFKLLNYFMKIGVKNVFRKLRDIYGLHNRPSENTINRIVQKFQEIGGR